MPELISVPDEDVIAFIQRLHAQWATQCADFAGSDPVLSTLIELAGERDATDRRIRAVLAYARSRPPRPYPLVVLADAVGMSVSGVSTAFRQDDIDTVRCALSDPARKG